jgi:NAD(P)-dependent dehydrogenase (short-subunit alcohol dehydrogenase family)
MSSEVSICIVTGGSNGIGLAIVQALLKHSTIVYNLDVAPPSLDLDGLEQATRLQRFFYLQTDVGDSTQLCAQFNSIWETHGRIDCVVNNAGIYETTVMGNVAWNEETLSSDVNQILQVNIGGVVHGTRTAVMLMRKSAEGDRTIINIASLAALSPFPMHPVYGATKAAVLYFTRTANLDLRSEGFRLCSVCPGITDTAMGRMGGQRDEEMVAKLKGGRRTSPELVAKAVVDFWRKDPDSIFDVDTIVVDDHEIRPLGNDEV